MTNWIRRLTRRLRALIHPGTLDRDVEDEMRLHIEMEAHDLARAHGLSAAEARRKAAIAFGGVDRFAEEHRDARGVRWIEEIGQDVRYAARALRRSPGFTLTATLVLALGIGASTAIFSAVDAVLVSRLPYPADDRLVRIYQQNSPTNRFGLSAADYLALAAQQRSFVSVGALRGREATVAVDGRVRRSASAPRTQDSYRHSAYGQPAGGSSQQATSRRTHSSPLQPMPLRCASSAATGRALWARQ